MNLVDKLSLVFLVLTLGAQILYRRSFWFRNEVLGIRFQVLGRLGDYLKKYFLKRESFSRFLRLIWIISVVLVFGVITYWAVLQYKLWASNDLTKLLLPPHQSFGYFYSYVGKRFFTPWLISLLFAIVVSRISKRLNKRFGERFFEDEEVELISFGIFLTGYPGFFIYLPLLLAVYLAFQIISNIRVAFFSREAENISEESRTHAEGDTGLRRTNQRNSAFSRRLSAYYLWIPTAILAMIIKIWLFPIFGLDVYLGNFAV